MASPSVINRRRLSCTSAEAQPENEGWSGEENPELSDSGGLASLQMRVGVSSCEAWLGLFVYTLGGNARRLYCMWYLFSFKALLNQLAANWASSAVFNEPEEEVVEYTNVQPVPAPALLCALIFNFDF